MQLPLALKAAMVLAGISDFLRHCRKPSLVNFVDAIMPKIE
jgi:hypothetical protein